MAEPSNKKIADVLERIADLLELKEANPFRVRAYRNGAETVRATEESVAALVNREDSQALQALPDIGEGLAGVITEVVHTSRSSLLERLETEASPEELFSQVPGIGPALAHRIVTGLNIDTLEGLERAAHDGRLEQVEGFGPKRVRAVQVSLAGLLSGGAQRRRQQAGEGEETGEERPDIQTLLEVDAEYRRKAEADELRKIAPRRFNPKNEAWLPIMHTERAGWDFTALYSNTAQAHELGATRDWVVIYYQRPGQEEDQATVVTESHGPLKGKRVVRGREVESRRYYASKD